MYHVDGFRYDCVPNYWDGPLGVGYASLVFETYQLAKSKLAQADPAWRRFDGGPGKPPNLVQMAEQLEDPQGVLRTTYSNSTWQNSTFDAARSVARGDRGRLFDLGLQLGLFGYPEQETTNDVSIPKTALQYIENHDHERFLCNFGTYNPDEAGNPLFQEGDRSRWFMLQPYLIALLMSKGIPLLWQGEEFAENYFLPDVGEGRVALLRPLRWDYFYDGSGQPIVTSAASLDHALWFHQPFRADEWLLYSQESPFSGGARGFARGSIFSRPGRACIATRSESSRRRVRSSWSTMPSSPRK